MSEIKPPRAKAIPRIYISVPGNGQSATALLDVSASPEVAIDILQYALKKILDVPKKYEVVDVSSEEFETLTKGKKK